MRDDELPKGLDARGAAVLRELVEHYVETGGPVGSRTLSRALSRPLPAGAGPLFSRAPLALSPATIRNVMADLTDAGLLFAPHTSAGRLPTDQGLRLFVDALLQVGELPEEEQESISQQLASHGRSLEQTLSEAGAMLSGVSAAASLVVAPKRSEGLRHIEFVPLAHNRALVILVGADGQVENRVIDTPPGLPPSSLTEAGNYLNAHLKGAGLDELRRFVDGELAANRTKLDALAASVVAAGLATWTQTGGVAGSGLQGSAHGGSLIVRGQGKLLADITQMERLADIQRLFERLEAQETMLKLLEMAEGSDGVRIFIGAESSLFGTAGLSMLVAPARNREDRIVGALGVIGPTRINYGRIIPVINYTARVVGALLG